MTIHGTAIDAFTGVRDLFAQNLEDGEELGASLAVDVDGERVVDLWGGYRDPGLTDPWTKDTLINVFSTTKLISALAALVLADRGLLDLDAPVARYWPEFAAHGKENVLVRHVLGHTSGVSAWEQPVTTEDLYDLPASTARLAAQEPWWEPGTASGYHAVTYGHLIGEMVRRVDGRSLTRFVDEELSAPLGADVQIGARESDWPRVATLVPPPPMDMNLDLVDQSSTSFRTLTSPAPDPAAASTPEWRHAEIGAVNGHASADGLVTLLRTVTLGGTADGVRLLSPSTIDRIFEAQSDGVDLVHQVPMRWGIGFALTPVSIAPFLPDGRVAWWGGMGGSIAVLDLERRVTIAYTPNNMDGGGLVGFDRVGTYITEAYEGL